MLVEALRKSRIWESAFTLQKLAGEMEGEVHAGAKFPNAYYQRISARVAGIKREGGRSEAVSEAPAVGS